MATPTGSNGSDPNTVLYCLNVDCMATPTSSMTGRILIQYDQNIPICKSLSHDLLAITDLN